MGQIPVNIEFSTESGLLANLYADGYSAAPHTCPSAERAEEPPLTEEERKLFLYSTTSLSEEATTWDWWAHILLSLDIGGYLDRRAVREMVGKETT